MTPSRKRIAMRAFRSLVALLAGAGVAAVASPEFREFVGDETVTAILVALVPPALQAAGKWSRER